MRHLALGRLRGHAARWVGFLALGALAFGPGCVGPGAWRELAAPGGPPFDYVRGFVVDTAGVPWVVSNEGLFWWDGTNWQEVDEDEVQRTARLSAGQLWGGPDRGAYLSLPGADEHHGALYRLSNGRLEKYCDFYYAHRSSEPGLYASRGGDLFNWSPLSIAVLRGGQWEIVETRTSAPRIVDLGPDGPVVFLRSDGTGICIWDGERFLTNVPIPGLPSESEKWKGKLHGCRWGKNRILLMPSKVEYLAAIEVGREVTQVDVSRIVEAIGPETHVWDMWGGPDGSVWLVVSKRGVSGRFFIRVGPDGSVTERRDTCRMISGGPGFVREPHRMIQTRDGSVWFGPKAAMYRLRDSGVECFDWRQGIQISFVKGFWETPGGRLFTAAWPNKVFEWKPGARPVPIPARGWKEVTCVKRPLSDPCGRVWAFRKDKPDHVSLWDGKEWTHVRIPFACDRASNMVADDTAHLVCKVGRWEAGHYHQEGFFDVGPKGVFRHASYRDALVARVEAGARRFTGKMVAVTRNGRRLWLAEVWGDRTKVSLYEDGAWKDLGEYPFRLQQLAVDEEHPDQDPIFLGMRAKWGYRDGQIVKVEEAPDRGEDMKMVGPRLCRRVPFFPGLPEAFRRQHLVLTNKGGYRYAPVSWEEAERIARGEAWERPEHLVAVNLKYALQAIPDSEGGFWIRHGGPSFNYRYWAGMVVEIDGRGTPLLNRKWFCIGQAPRGGVWVQTEHDVRGHQLFIHEDPKPKVRVKRVKVRNGRHVTITWDADPHIIAVFYRVEREDATQQGGWQQAPADGQIGWTEDQPGKRTATVILRAMDSVGIVGQPVRRKVNVDVRPEDNR